jgi:hypothetical protein
VDDHMCSHDRFDRQVELVGAITGWQRWPDTGRTSQADRPVAWHGLT